MSKRIRKFLFRSVIFCFLIVCITITSGYFWLKDYSWTEISSENEMKENGLVVLNSPDLPDEFYEIYDVLYPNQRNVTMTRQLLNSLVGSHNKKDCKCDDIGYISWNNDNLNLKLDLGQLLKSRGYWKFGFGLEKYATPKKCFDYYINNDIFFEYHYLQNLDELSKKVLNKKVQNLNVDEILKLIAWHNMLRRGRGKIEDVEERFFVLKKTYTQRVKFSFPLKKGEKEGLKINNFN